ncbi:hypothetical protein FA95DRAFT_1612201 [Auriscalpium vulgare]|uniref:Uncharacterized protein n=1 Tax=Auriscalpium vulgare TaxID=40419 RepID=A0ACB8R708_9AGAM|nr:hypothetical protein FA95DRAFT_1612201 [Auriscalpium vulgare]
MPKVRVGKTAAAPVQSEADAAAPRVSSRLQAKNTGPLAVARPSKAPSRRKDIPKNGSDVASDGDTTAPPKQNGSKAGVKKNTQRQRKRALTSVPLEKELSALAVSSDKDDFVMPLDNGIADEDDEDGGTSSNGTDDGEKSGPGSDSEASEQSEHFAAEGDGVASAGPERSGKKYGKAAVRQLVAAAMTVLSSPARQKGFKARAHPRVIRSDTDSGEERVAGLQPTITKKPVAQKRNKKADKGTAADDGQRETDKSSTKTAAPSTKKTAASTTQTAAASTTKTKTAVSSTTKTAVSSTTKTAVSSTTKKTGSSTTTAASKSKVGSEASQTPSAETGTARNKASSADARTTSSKARSTDARTSSSASKAAGTDTRKTSSQADSTDARTMSSTASTHQRIGDASATTRKDGQHGTPQATEKAGGGVQDEARAEEASGEAMALDYRSDSMEDSDVAHGDAADAPTSSKRRWPQSTDLVLLDGSKGLAGLTEQRPSVRDVITEANTRQLPRVLCLNHCMPSGPLLEELSREALILAAEARGEEDIAARLRAEKPYASLMGAVTRARASTFRSETAKKRTEVDFYTLYQFNKLQTKERIADAVASMFRPNQPMTFAFSGDPALGTYNAQEPCCHEAVIAILRLILLSKKRYDAFPDDFFTSSIEDGNGADELEMPIPMVAYAATLVAASLKEYQTGVKVAANFTVDSYAGLYKTLMDELHHARAVNLSGFHSVMHFLYLSAKGMVMDDNEDPSFVPESSAPKASAIDFAEVTIGFATSKLNNNALEDLEEGESIAMILESDGDDVKVLAYTPIDSTDESAVKHAYITASEARSHLPEYVAPAFLQNICPAPPHIKTRGSHFDSPS